MENNAQLETLLDEVLQPRQDFFAIDKIRPLLAPTIEKVASIGDECWDSLALLALAEAIRSGHLELRSQQGQGEKGIHGSNPAHGALLKLAKAQGKTARLDDRLALLAHIINAAFQWRIDMLAAEENQNFTEQHEKRLKKATYLKNLEAACKVVRRIEANWLDFLTPLDQPTEELHKRCDAHEVDEDTKQQDIYIRELGRFFAYALNKRQPRRGYQEEKETSSENKPSAKRRRRFDDDPDDRWKETSTSVITLPPDIDAKIEGELRTSGLSTIEERPFTELTQSDTPIKAAKGDSSLQAVFRTRSQQVFLDKAGQLLPGRWEHLSTFDLFHLFQQLNQLTPGQRRRIECVIGLLLMTGRGLKNVLNAQIVTSDKQIPQIISEQSIYVFYRDSPSWLSGVYRPESSRQLTGEWPPHMRRTKDRITLPISEFCWQLIASHSRRLAYRVKERSRSLALFPKEGWEELESDLKALLSDTNLKTGSRLTTYRLGAHLFNTLTEGDSDLTAACLLTARTPSFGQQASLYYYAPSTNHLEQRYIKSLRTIEHQCSAKPLVAEAKYSDAIEGMVKLSGKMQYVGSKLVPEQAYVKILVDNMQQQIKAAQKDASPDGLFSMHNAYVAYTVAMLMFSTGYRSIRDPLPQWDSISLSRKMIVIADKTDDKQSHARFLPLIDIMVAQLQRYYRHRQNIVERLKFFLQKDWQTPFMFLDDNGNPKAVTPSLLKNQLNWPDAPPLNINRHFLHTHLKESGCSSEIVDGFMGHWDAGQEPWARYSTFCPREYRNILAPNIERLMVQLGWKPLTGAAL